MSRRSDINKDTAEKITATFKTISDARKDGTIGSAGAGALVFAVILIFLLFIAAAALVIHGFLGLFVWAGWNLGIVNLVAACGGHVGTITYLGGVGISFAIGGLRRMFRGSETA